MTLSTRLAIPTFSLLTLLGVGGCTQSYNGALGFGLPDRQDSAYAAESRESRSAMTPPRQGRDSIARFDDQTNRGTASRRPVAYPSEPVQASASAAAPSERPEVSLASRSVVGSARLFGEFRGPVKASSGTSLDNLQQVTFSDVGGDFDPDSDADGTLLVFASTRHSEQPDLYWKKMGAVPATRLTEDPGQDVMPDVSSDGKMVVFASDRSGSWDIYLMEIGAKTAIRLTDDLAEEVHPSFSPDGRHVVYSSFNEQNGTWELVVIDTNNPGVKTFLGPGLFPSWSPVDNRIVYQRARERGDRRFGIWMLEYVDGQSTLPTELAASSNAAAITPDWSPDGKYIVFTTVVDPGTAGVEAEAGPTDIWLMKADGSGRTRLTGGRFENLLPTWGGDGLVYYVSDRSGTGIQNIWAVRPDQALRLVQTDETKLGDAGTSVGPGLPGAP